MRRVAIAHFSVSRLISPMGAIMKFQKSMLAVLLAAAGLAIGSSAEPVNKPQVSYDGVPIEKFLAENEKGSELRFLLCSWTCGNGTTGSCYPPSVETCIQEANSACRGQE
jgi:hypothetical protein